MYLPKAFAVSDLPRLHDFMDEFNFAAVVTQHAGELTASHVPFILDRSAGPNGTLRAHIAIRNPQLEHFRSGSEALVIFQGPHTYVSPNWYVNPQNVPTWNYSVVHAHGTPKIGGLQAMIALLSSLVAKHEKPFEKPWRFDPEDAWIKKLLNEIVAFEMPITRLEGKFKLNQNRAPEDRDGVIAAFSSSEDPAERAVALLMTQHPPGDLS
jgi:transcriptional regulator